MKVNIVAVGTLQEKFKSIFSDYVNKILPWAQVNVIEIKEKNDINIKLKKTKESKLILEKIPAGSFVILCSLQGKSLSSEEFSKTINKSNVYFVIGGSDGVVEEMFDKYLKIKFSSLTFPHQLFRILLVEQIYRGLSIISNKRYHK